MADIVLKDRAGDDNTYEDVEHVVLLDTDGNQVVYSLQGTAYDYSYTIRST